jgi:hypothetical protein
MILAVKLKDWADPVGIAGAPGIEPAHGGRRGSANLRSPARADRAVDQASCGPLPTCTYQNVDRLASSSRTFHFPRWSVHPVKL